MSRIESEPAADDRRHVLISGASRGIGAACARAVLDAGHEVIGLSRKRGDMPAEAHHIAVDLSDLAKTSALMPTLLRQHPVDALICNPRNGLCTLYPCRESNTGLRRDERTL